MARRLNKKRLETLAVWLEGGAKHEKITFDMHTGIQFNSEDFDPEKPAECGTSCCLAGAAVQFFDPKTVAALAKRSYDVRSDGGRYDLEDNFEVRFYGEGGVMDDAAKLLGLDGFEACQLFLPNEHFDHSLAYYSDPKLAARVVRNLIETGKVDWDIEYNPEPA